MQIRFTLLIFVKLNLIKRMDHHLNCSIKSRYERTKTLYGFVLRTYRYDVRMKQKRLKGLLSGNTLDTFSTLTYIYPVFCAFLSLQEIHAMDFN